jgi:hypothetical protein
MYNKAMKPPLEFFPVETVPWTPCGPGLAERILSHDAKSGVSTRMLQFTAGTTTEATLTHEFWEEVWIVSGGIRDLRLNQTFTESMYACRPPGMPHGPWHSSNGCITFEVRYPPSGGVQ